MQSINLCVLLICVVTFQALVVEAALPACTGTSPTVCGVDNADSCSSAGTPLCLCNVNYVEDSSSTSCALIDCTTAATDCATGATATGTACTTDAAPKCSCLANFETSSTNPTTACTQITCTTATASLCTVPDANSYCLDPNCVCKKNFIGTDLANCKRQTCANDAACTETNSACHTTGTVGCGCDTLYQADVTTGACSTQKTCTVATVTADCGTNTVCEGSPLSCFCQSNYEAGATGCVEKTCTGTETTNCDANSQCSSSKCVCADNFLGTSRVCECPTGFSLDGSVCKKNCTANSECGTNGACFKKFCECEPNYAGTAPTTCTQLACSGNTTTKCAANSSCVADKCVCSKASFVEGANKLVCATAGCEGIFCNFSLLMASLLMFFFAGKRFE